MTQPRLHLIKLIVGLSNFSELDAFQCKRIGTKNPYTGQIELAHITRQTPKRADELLAGGSIYWVMSGMIVGRQSLLALKPVEIEGKAHCAIILGRPLIRVAPRPRRPFQGWRYFNPEDAPPDLATTDTIADMPPDMYQELVKLGLL